MTTRGAQVSVPLHLTRPPPFGTHHVPLPFFGFGARMFAAQVSVALHLNPRVSRRVASHPLPILGDRSMVGQAALDR